MMKKILVAFLVILTLYQRPARAVITDAPSEQAVLTGHYAELIASLALYGETIAEAEKYIKSVGRTLGENAVMKALSSISTEDLASFQDTLNFSDASSFSSLLGKKASDFLDDNGMKDWRVGVSDSIDQLKQEVGGAVQTVQDTATDVKGKVTDAVDQATETVKDTASKVKEGVTKSISETSSKKPSDSAAARVVIVESNFGQPQPNKQAAQNFIRSRYYYSYKDGDTYMGKPLADVSEAHGLVRKNRVGYYQEVVTTALATAYEGLTTVKKDSVSRMNDLKERAEKVESLDDRKAVEALIVQEEVRQRMLRLNFEIALLEKEVVDEMMTIEPEYVIARTPEQITNDTKKIEVKEEQ